MSVEIEPTALTPEAFSGFGDVIQTENRQAFEINQGTTLRFNNLAEIDISDGGGKPIVSIFRSLPRNFPFEIRMLERHPLGSQAFFPLSGRSYLVVVADQTNDLKPGKIQCFIASNSQGVNYHKGIWHHPLIAVDETSDFLVVDRSGPGENLEEIWLSEDQCRILPDPKN